MSDPWYHDFFTGVVVELWQDAAAVFTQPEVNFLERALKLAPAARVLDVPCGFGRHALELARRGCRLTGIDVSPEMLAEAERSAAAESLSVEFRQGDMAELRLEGTFDAAYCFGNSFGYLDPKGTEAFLQSVASSLQPGGRFAFDYGLAAECILPRFVEREWDRIGELLFLEENRYDLDQGYVETSYTFMRDGDAQTRTGKHWVYTLRVVRKMLDAAGFAVESMYKSLADEPFELGSPVLIVVASKRL